MSYLNKIVDDTPSYILTFKYLKFHKPCKFMDFKNRMHLKLKVNKRGQEGYVNCVIGLLEGGVIPRCMSVRKIYNDGSFQSRRIGLWTESTDRQTRRHSVLGTSPGSGDGSELRDKFQMYLLMSKVSMIAEENRRP